MSKFNAFRRKLDINKNCIEKYESSFIIEGTSAVNIYSLRLSAYKQAAIIITDKEGPDTSLVYTFKEQTKEQELLKGDYYIWNDNTYLVYEDVQIVLDAKYKKQKSYQCNVSFNYNCDCGYGTYFGYFVSSLAKYVDTSLQGNLNITYNDKPILILPMREWVKIGTHLVIDNKPYKIIEFDATTNKGIAYCSLDRDFINKQEDVVKIEPEENVLIAGIEQNLSIQKGYFKTSCKVDIVSKTNDNVKFIIPYGIESITVNTKDIDGNNIDTVYKVVV